MRSRTQESWLKRWRKYHEMYPLWKVVTDTVPDVVLQPPMPRMLDVLNVCNLGFRRSRRYVEIRDALLNLRPYVGPSPPLSEVSGGRAVAEAARIKSAVSRFNAGTPLRLHQTLDAHGTVLLEGGDDLRSEMEFLVEVARAIRRDQP